jgi:spore photoproduct lyase
MDYLNKYNDFITKINHTNLPTSQAEFIKQKFLHYKFSFSQLKQLFDIAIDLHIWNEKSIDTIWKESHNKNDKQAKKEVMKHIIKLYDTLKNSHKSYDNFDFKKLDTRKIELLNTQKDKNAGLGMCPVASPKTRCCNLLTLDVVESCGFDCSYCSIQSFYNQNRVFIQSNLKEKLDNLHFDPDQTYHIGTGQSSDSLMWGNRNGILDDLINFAKKHPNVILEFKTKSDNITYLLEHDIPKNIIVTWSLNPQTIIDHEERLTASLDNRIQAAKQLSEKNILVGFHFHPMMIYKDYQKEYQTIFDNLLNTFTPDQVALVSLGTLTFIKPVIKQIRNRDFKSKILQMPLVECEGKLSYPTEQKLEMFKFAYNALKPWHGKVFFYMCMELQELWEPVFGYRYESNEKFEEAMKEAYFGKIKQLIKQ